MGHGQDSPRVVVSGTTAYAGSKESLLNLLETEFLRPEGEPKALQHWFLRDTWTMAEGLMLLMDIDPRASKLRPSAHLCDGDKVPLDEFSFIALLDGRTIDFQAWQVLFEHNCVSEQRRREVRRMMQMTGEQFRESRSLWQSGMHPERNPPAYYVAWAKFKNISVKWLEWARKHGYLELEAASAYQHPASPSSGSATIASDGDGADAGTACYGGTSGGRRERQIKAIIAEAQGLGFEPMSIPYPDGKKKVKEACLRNYSSDFTESGFKEAWKVANDLGVISVEGKSRFNKRTA